MEGQRRISGSRGTCALGSAQSRCLATGIQRTRKHTKTQRRKHASRSSPSSPFLIRFAEPAPLWQVSPAALTPQQRIRHAVPNRADVSSHALRDKSSCRDASWISKSNELPSRPAHHAVGVARWCTVLQVLQDGVAAWISKTQRAAGASCAVQTVCMLCRKATCRKATR